jgi:acetoacetyl-CoA reductase/3-oxoacyl-[acyl-carrier protein] reductase
VIDRALDGKTALVTGGGGDIGRVIVETLERQGARVFSLDIVHASGSDEGSATQRGAIECDLRSEESVAAAFRAIGGFASQVDILVHAAGVSRDAVVWKMSVEDWDFVHSVNLRGAFLAARAAIPLMRDRGGAIVLVGSINGSRGKRGTAAYSASKAGLIGFAKSLARETGRFGITANVVEPGWVRTRLTEQYAQELRDAARAETLLGELVTPDDVAATVSFLCGPGGKRITGQVIRVDAGQYL